MSEDSLAGVGVLVTRPRHQADELAAAIEAEGGQPVLFPALEILARPDADVARDAGQLASPVSVSICSLDGVPNRSSPPLMTSLSMMPL